MYGQYKYGELRYASEQTRNDDEAYYIDLTKLLPDFVTEKKEMSEIYRSQGYEAGYLECVLKDMEDQCYIPTATWNLERWETVFDINSNLNLTYEQRREILFAKIRGQGTTTVQMIKETAAAFSGGEVDVIEDNPSSRFIVRFIGIKGIPRNMQGFISMLEEIKPAHLAYDFEYRYTIWSELVGYTWNELSSMSWDALRLLKEE